MYCGNCGKEIPDGNAFCPFCGAKCRPADSKKENAPVKSPGKTGKKKKKGKTWLIIVIVIIVIAGLSKVISPGSTEKAEPKATQAATTPYVTEGQKAVTEEKTAEASKVQETAKSQIDPDLKAFLESYEAYIDEYVAFLKKYKANPTDLTLLTKYADMMEKADDFSRKADSYDQKDMNPEELKYYLETMARIEQKLLGAL